MRTTIWNQFALGLLLAIPAFGQRRPAATSTELPILLDATLPAYPPIWRAAHLSGRVVVLVTVKQGRVAETDVKSGDPHLRFPTIANLKTWRFDDSVNDQFTVTYTYQMSGEPTDGPTNPNVEMLPSLDVIIIARPVKPTVNY
ncbi:MAG: hypothetical protein ACRD3N_01865 [Terracidiphilus sp.]